MAIIKLNGKKGITYQAKVRGNDGQWVSQVFATKKEAKNYEVDLKQKRLQGALAPTAASQITFDEFFDQWFETIEHQATPSWRLRQKTLYRLYIQPILGNRKLSQITPPLIAHVLGRVADKGRSPAMQLHVYVVLRKIFSDAIEIFELLPKNPVIRKLKPRLVIKEAKYLGIEEIRKLLVHVSGKSYELAVWLGLYMGLRVGEIQALRWEDADLERGILHIRRTFCKQEGVFRDFPKGKKQHSHRLPQELLNKLKEAKESARSELVVMPPIGQMLDYWLYRKALRRYCREAGVTVISTHGLRHSTSELYMAHGATRDDLKLLFAHSSNSTTDRYVHDKGSRLEKVAEVIRLFPECSKNVPKSENAG